MHVKTTLIAVLLSALAATAVFMLRASPIQDMPSSGLVARVQIGERHILAEYADTPEAMARGLGGRDSLPPDRGMLFRFIVPGVYSFWMKDMRFPLDIVWLHEGRVVGVTADIDPQIGASDDELRRYMPPGPVTDVLELAAGRAEALGIQAGSKLDIRVP